MNYYLLKLILSKINIAKIVINVINELLNSVTNIENVKSINTDVILKIDISKTYNISMLTALCCYHCVGINVTPQNRTSRYHLNRSICHRHSHSEDNFCAGLSLKS